MKTLFITMLLVLGYSVSAADVVKLWEHEDSSEYIIPNRACYKAASTYMKTLSKLERKQGVAINDLPFLKEEKNGQEVIISGVVKTSRKIKIIEITETEGKSGNSKTFRFHYPEKATLLVFNNPNGSNLQIHASGSCTKMASANVELGFACETKNGFERKVITSSKESDSTNENKLFARMEDMANYHSANRVNEKMEKHNLKMPNRYLSACLSYQETKSFSPEKIFAEVFPKVPFVRESNGFGGGTSTSKVASSRR